MFPKFTTEKNFADDDPLWGMSENDAAVQVRATDILDSIFNASNKDKNCRCSILSPEILF